MFNRSLQKLLSQYGVSKYIVMSYKDDGKRIKDIMVLTDIGLFNMNAQVAPSAHDTVKDDIKLRTWINIHNCPGETQPVENHQEHRD